MHCKRLPTELTFFLLNTDQRVLGPLARPAYRSGLRRRRDFEPSDLGLSDVREEAGEMGILDPEAVVWQGGD
jgi:hypothetical protein